MFNRLSHKHFVKNILLQDIKANYTLEMNYAIAFGKMIKDHYGFDITEDELGYLAIYFALSNSKEKKVKRVIILCNYGIATSRLIKEQIQDKFPELEVVGIYPVYYLEAVAGQDVDLIISTINIDPEKVHKPVIVMNQILDGDSFNDIQKVVDGQEDGGLTRFLSPDAFFILQAKTKDEALKKLSQKMLERGFLTKETIEKIYERESISSTDMGNLIAIPHALIDDKEQSIIGIGILEKPVTWDKEKVQIVFMIGLSRKDAGENNIFRQLYRIVKDVSTVNHLVDAKRFDLFLKVCS